MVLPRNGAREVAIELRILDHNPVVAVFGVHGVLVDRIRVLVSSVCVSSKAHAANELSMHVAAGVR